MSFSQLLRLASTTSLLLAVAGGCAHRCVPAIDPSGERIFRNSTMADCGPGPFFQPPVPAYREPPAPPACAKSGVCGTGVAVAPTLVAPVNPSTVPPGFALNVDPPSPQITLTPQRFVAPVGTDVVLVAGLCAPNGRYVTRQPIEWMLAPEGVGYIVEVGQEKHLPQLHFCSTTPKKVDTTYALAHTASISQTITRGTNRGDDDLRLRKGESWISVSSPQEGTTYVTAFAPKENHWDRRKQIATIHWVDAKWTFPPPAIVRPTEKHLLKTRVLRTDGQPVAGWLVRYDILDGPPAGFGAAGERTAQIPTDINGEANVELLPQSREAGITQLRVQIIRPDPSKPNEAPLLMGQGFTHVQWSTPGLLVRGEATQETQPDGVINYRIEVVNNGDQLTRDVVLNFTPPAGVGVLASNPQAQAFGQRLEWRLGNLNPRSAQGVTISARGSAAGDVQSCFAARSADGLETPPTCFRTRVNTAAAAGALALRVQGPPGNVTVGDQVTIFFDVTNTSNAVVTGIVARATFDDGFEHIQRLPSPLQNPIDNLQPGQREQSKITLNVLRPGDLCCRIDIQADNGISQSQRHCVRAVDRVVQRPMRGELRINAVANPVEARVGDKVVFIAEATNAGGAPLTNVRIEMAAADNLDAIEASKDFKQGNDGVFWVVPRLDPGQTVSPQIGCNCLRAGDGVVQIKATSDQSQPIITRADVRIVGMTPAPVEPQRPAVPPVDPGPDPMPMPPPRLPAALKVTAEILSNPIAEGADTPLIVRIVNDSAVGDQNVTVRLELPEGLTFLKADAPAAVGGISADKRIIDLVPIREVRGGETMAPIKLRIAGARPGKYQVQVIVLSASHPTGIARDARVEVFPKGR